MDGWMDGWMDLSRSGGVPVDELTPPDVPMNETDGTTSL